MKQKHQTRERDPMALGRVHRKFVRAVCGQSSDHSSRDVSTWHVRSSTGKVLRPASSLYGLCFAFRECCVCEGCCHMLS